MQGWAAQRDPDTIADYDLIKLKARGMMSLAKFKATPTNILKRAYQSPICVGPLPPLHDVKLVLNGEQVPAGAAIKKVCDELGLMCVVPIE